jgi:hypothetical protein
MTAQMDERDYLNASKGFDQIDHLRICEPASGSEGPAPRRELVRNGENNC